MSRCGDLRRVKSTPDPDTFEKYCNTTPISIAILFWEVLNGVGVDGVGVIFPFFTHFSPFFTHFSPFPMHFSASPKDQQFTARMGNFTPTTSAPTPCKTSRFLERRYKKTERRHQKNRDKGTILAETITKEFLGTILFVISFAMIKNNSTRRISL